MSLTINPAQLMAIRANAMSQANTVEALANNLASEINRLDIMEQNLRSVWIGQASNTFRSRISMLRAELSTQRRQMLDLAMSIRRAADAVR